MDLLQHGVDRPVIALWLGHESVETTRIYLRADMRLKEKALLFDNSGEVPKVIALERNEMVRIVHRSTYTALVKGYGRK
jgi:hypothetical protein